MLAALDADREMPARFHLNHHKALSDTLALLMARESRIPEAIGQGCAMQ